MTLNNSGSSVRVRIHDREPLVIEQGEPSLALLVRPLDPASELVLGNAEARITAYGDIASELTRTALVGQSLDASVEGDTISAASVVPLGRSIAIADLRDAAQFDLADVDDRRLSDMLDAIERDGVASLPLPAPRTIVRGTDRVEEAGPRYADLVEAFSSVVRDRPIAEVRTQVVQALAGARVERDEFASASGLVRNAYTTFLSDQILELEAAAARLDRLAESGVETIAASSLNVIDSVLLAEHEVELQRSYTEEGSNILRLPVYEPVVGKRLEYREDFPAQMEQQMVVVGRSKDAMRVFGENGASIFSVAANVFAGLAPEVGERLVISNTLEGDRARSPDGPELTIDR